MKEHRLGGFWKTSIFLTVLKAGNSTIECQCTRVLVKTFFWTEDGWLLALSSSSGKGKWSPPGPLLALVFQTPRTCWVLSGPQTAGEDEGSKAGSCPFLSWESNAFPWRREALPGHCLLQSAVYPQADREERQTASSERPWTLNRRQAHYPTHLHCSTEKTGPEVTGLTFIGIYMRPSFQGIPWQLKG